MNTKVLRKKQFITDVQCDELNAWVREAVENKWLDFGIDGHSGGLYKNRLTTRVYGGRFKYPKIVYNVFEQITEFLSLHDLRKSEFGGGQDGIVVSYVLTDGDVHKHMDIMEGSKHVLRCNLMTQKADDGARLYIDEKHIDIEVGELHCYLPSSVSHYVTKVKGQTPRIIWMFGYKCDKERFDQLFTIALKKEEVCLLGSP